MPDKNSRIVGSTNRISGVGLHSGLSCTAVVHSSAGSGLMLLAAPDSSPVPVGLSTVQPAARRTIVAGVQTMEHLLSALAGLGIFEAIIEVTGGEVPILDGSARPWVDNLLSCVQMAAEPAAEITIKSSFRYRHGAALVELAPASEGVVEGTIEYAHPLIGRQHRQWSVGDRPAFIRDLAPARTFGFTHEVQVLREQGLIAGGGLDNAVVFGPEGLENPEGLRFQDEPIRHKLLDAIGDLALMGGPIKGHVRLTQWSHADLVQALQLASRGGIFG